MKRLEDQYKSLKFMIDNNINTDTKECKENYLTKVLYNILSMAIDVDQEYMPNEIEECRKVIKVKRLNSSVDIMRKSHPEILVFEGIYLIATGIFIPKNVMESIGYDTMNKKWGKLDISNLPNGYVYSTLKDIGNGCGFALKKSDISDNINNRSSSWEYFGVQDYIL